MDRSHHIFLRRATYIAALLVIGWAVLGPISSAGAVTKTFALTMSGSVAPGASGQQVTATITDQVATGLESANVNAPSGFTITAASLAPSDSGTISFTGGQVQLRNLSLSAGGDPSALVTITVSVPCAGGASATWSAAAKQTPDFSGGANKSFTPNPGTSPTAFTGHCHVTWLNQPAWAEKNATITTANFDPAATKLQVEVDDATGVVIANSTATVSLSLGTNPTGGTLSGSNPISFTGGVATFAPSINRSGFGDTLVASATGGVIDPATSSSFRIYDKACGAAQPCSADAPQGLLNVNIQASSSSGDVLVAFNAEATPDCGDTFNHLPNTVTLDTLSFTPTGNKVVTLRVAKSFDHQQANNGVTFYQMCYSSPTPFTDRSGNVVNTGLLPDCATQDPVPPCVLSKSKSNSGDVLITLLLPPGDPRVH